MEDVRIKFYGVANTEDHTLEAYVNDDEKIFIEIIDPSSFSWITLNKATAIQLVKKLKLEISKLNENG